MKEQLFLVPNNKHTLDQIHTQRDCQDTNFKNTFPGTHHNDQWHFFCNIQISLFEYLTKDCISCNIDELVIICIKY